MGKGKGKVREKDGPDYHAFARNGQVEELKQASTNELLCPDFLKRTPLHLAAFAGQLETVEYICQKCPATALREAADGFLPVHFAVQQGHLHVVKALLKCTSAEGVTAKRLMQRVVKGKRTLLHLALAKQHIDVGSYLVEKGVDTFALTDKDKLALDFLDKDKIAVFMKAVGEHQEKQTKKRQPSSVQIEKKAKLDTEVEKEEENEATRGEKKEVEKEAERGEKGGFSLSEVLNAS